MRAGAKNCCGVIDWRAADSTLISMIRAQTGFDLAV